MAKKNNKQRANKERQLAISVEKLEICIDRIDKSNLKPAREQLKDV